MNQSRYGTLISLLLLLFLTAGFFFAARFALKAVNGSVQKAIATATVVVLPPSPTPAVQPTKAAPKPQRSAVQPKPTATPNQLGQVVISTTGSADGAASTFPQSTTKFWCVANLPTTPLGTGIIWKWQHVTGNSTEEIWTSPAYTYSSVVRAGWIDGPFAAGKYRCTVLAGTQILGAADFSVQ